MKLKIILFATSFAALTAGCGNLQESQESNAAPTTNGAAEDENPTEIANTTNTPAPSLIVRVPIDKDGNMMQDQAELRVLEATGVTVDEKNAGQVWRDAKAPADQVTATELDKDTSTSQARNWRGDRYYYGTYYYWSYNNYYRPYYYNYGTYYYYNYPQYYRTYYPNYYGYAYYYYPNYYY